MKKCTIPVTLACGVVALSMFMAGCQSTPESRSEQELPPIISRLVKNGKGQPNGRSDANPLYLRSPLKVSSDPGYGSSQFNAIGVPVKDHNLYLNSLRGMEGQAIEYERLGACCYGDGKSVAKGPVDIYRVRVDGKSKEVYLFLDAYKTPELIIPMGFQQRR